MFVQFLSALLLSGSIYSDLQDPVIPNHLHHLTFILIGQAIDIQPSILTAASKFEELEDFGAYIARQAFPAVLALPVAIFEMVVRLLTVTGLLTRYASYLLAVFCLFTAVAYYANGVPSMIKNIAIAEDFLVLPAAGAGTISINNRRRK